jgi:hypothetical protein
MNINRIKNLELDNNAQIISILSENIEITNKISGFQKEILKLNSYQEKMTDLFSQLGKDTLVIEKSKNERRNDLVKKTLPVITMLELFAYDKKKKKLSKRLRNLTPDHIQKSSDYKIIKISKFIWTIANKHGNYSLAFINKSKNTLNNYKSKSTLFKNRYGLSPEMIKSIEEANIKFIDSLLIYEDELKKNEKIIKKIKRINKQTEKLLLNKVDRYVLIFENENPEFIRKYLKAREKQLLKNTGEDNSNNDPENQSKKSSLKKTVAKKVHPRVRPRTQQRIVSKEKLEV